ncbi:glycosyltransferase family 4 protein [Halorubrum ezzemoulense]|uniref:glycosyltransferase family 4 protein n=1 Tax=Halorubrum ezzemoulense TaxID=337243 RepID=UPI00232AFB1A|nr:glycosyltransferase family 4 protein [Halorubrum ezzemoulense]MDB9302597.1 glycosyltransferase family 4 protein [Halorubrum ezzemoulense]
MPPGLDVGIVTPRFPPNIKGGGEISAKLLADNLYADSRISKVTVYSFDGDLHSNSGYDIVRLGDIRSEFKEWSNLYAYFKLNSRINKHDVIHSYNMCFHPVVGHFSEKFCIPSIATLNSYSFIRESTIGLNSRYLHSIYKKVSLNSSGRILIKKIRNIDNFIALSNSVKEIYENKILNGSNIQVIPNMIDTNFNTEAISNTIFQNNLIYVGRLSKEKGVKYLIGSLDYLSDEYSLVIVGDGSQKEELEKIASKRDLDDRIEFAGYIEQNKLNKYYEASDIFVHPGIWPEPFGRTLLEAMQADLPIVATNIGGPKDIVPNKELLCPPRDSEQLAKSIKLAEDMYNELDVQKYLYDNYHPSTITDEVIELYYETMKNK